MDEPAQVPHIDGDLEAPGAQEFSRTRTDIDRYRAGDCSALEALYERYEPGLRVLVSRRIQAAVNPAVRAMITVDDILQEVWTTAVRKIEAFEYRGPGSLFGWLEAIAGHAISDAADRWKASKRDVGREQSLEASSMEGGSEPADPAWNGPGPSTVVVRRERDERVHEAIASLPERPYRILTLRYFFGASWEEIALEVGSPSADAVRKELGALLPALGRRLTQV